ncbi:MAG: HAD hydrolase-like protein [Bacteroidia bacterium]
MNLIIFDIDGTLSQTDGIDTQCYVQAIEEVMEEKVLNTDWDSYENVTDEALTQLIFKNVLKRLPATHEVEQVKSRLVELLNFHSRKDPAAFREVAGAKLFFRKMMSQHDWAVAIATGCWHGSAEVKLAAIDFNRAGVPLATADLAATKPGILAEAERLAKEAHGQKEFARRIYVGDRAYDLRSAESQGMEFLGIDITGSGKLHQAGAPRVIKSFGQKLNL